MSAGDAKELCGNLLESFPSRFRRLLQAATVREICQGSQASADPAGAIEDGILHEGWIQKLGGGKGGRQSWKQRYLVVWGRCREYACYYYKQAGAAARNPAKATGEMDIAGYGVRQFDAEEREKFGRCGIRLLAGGDSPDSALRHSGRRTWFIRCGSPHEMKAWLHAFSLAACRRRGSTAEPGHPERAAFLEAYRRLRDECNAPPQAGPVPGAGGSPAEHLTSHCLDRVAVALGGRAVLETALPDSRSWDVVLAVRGVCAATWTQCERQGAVVTAEAQDAVDLSREAIAGADDAVRSTFREQYGDAMTATWEALSPRVEALLRLMAPPVRLCFASVVEHSLAFSKEVVEAGNDTRWAGLCRDTSPAFRPLQTFPSEEEWGVACSEMAHWGVLAEVRRGVADFIAFARHQHSEALKLARSAGVDGGGSPRSRCLAAAHGTIASREEPACLSVLAAVAARSAGPPMKTAILAPLAKPAPAAAPAMRHSIFAAPGAEDLPARARSSIIDNATFSRLSFASVPSGLAGGYSGLSGLAAEDERAAAVSAAVPPDIDGVIDWLWVVNCEADAYVRQRCEAAAQAALHRLGAAGHRTSDLTPELSATPTPASGISMPRADTATTATSSVVGTPVGGQAVHSDPCRGVDDAES
eukprot:TRINITY_DN1648_c0_g2_i1.p1 TRINITY_DN1648_c0_g2~~TRINITY_DN1648_c0_g2_i1.p1  ORF type:complete len:669 (+),score=160.93 TRINITY_DN1648_c0_g2_i1:75-2009(+)